MTVGDHSSRGSNPGPIESVPMELKEQLAPAFNPPTSSLNCIQKEIFKSHFIFQLLIQFKMQ